MGASRKLQGEIDRVLKKVQEGVEVFDSIWKKVYDTDNVNQKEKFEADLKKEIKKLQRYRDQIKTWIQSSEIKDKKALMDARKVIEKEMERFKICEKETKTKAFSKEGLGQQPKTDPKEKAKAETRDWLNNVVSDLESQIDSFEAEIEGLSVKKGKTRPPRLTHLESSITRHKAHIMKLELILRLLDNDELSPEQVNDVKDFLDDYVDRNQEDFDEFSDVDDLYSSLPLDKVEALEDLVTIGPPGLTKVGGALSMKNSLTTVPMQLMAPVSSIQQSTVIQEQVEETASQEINSDLVPRTPPPKSSLSISSAPVTPSANNPSPGASVPSSPINIPNLSKEEDASGFPVRKPSPALTDSGIRGIGKNGVSSNPAVVPLNPGSAVASNGALGTLQPSSEITKRNVLGVDERIVSSGIVVQGLGSPSSNRMILPQAAKVNDGISSADSNAADGGVTAGRVFSPPAIPGMQWRPGSPFQNQMDVGQFRGRTEITPDQREKFLQRFQQVQQQGQSNILGMPALAGGSHKQFSSQQPNPLLHQPNPVHSQSAQQALLSPGPTETDAGLSKVEETQQPLVDDLITETLPSFTPGKNPINDDDLKASYSALDATVGGVSGSQTEPAQLPKDIDLSPGQPVQTNPPSASLGVIGRRSISDLGAIGDNLGGSSSAISGGIHDQSYNLHMLESAFYKLPQPKDSERAKVYTPRHPAVTPASYPQVQAPIVNNPAFWERLGSDNYGTDTLFFAFYHQQNSYQQYLAAKELKKQSWRYHRKYNTWFQRHEEPKVTTDEYEQGTYVYFDFHVTNDELQNGWCQRIKTDFTFEYNYLEDELIV
ncbi:general negative regulator of transcription subunit 3 isoform X2 [Impatiens glandulifera]|uniref:general negative regulator of transcription subunit 3 isoform X2 n=1 Tax=Impatiens glandulifera TaxID=253017 RepID=UPI001FB111D8|nr:general negative regulator of transcription subunit 3 isoform X2 [Impatiens glandulifera]